MGFFFFELGFSGISCFGSLTTIGWSGCERERESRSKKIRNLPVFVILVRCEARET